MIRIVTMQSFTPLPFTLLGWMVPEIATAVAALIAKGMVFERYPWFDQDALGIWTAPGGTRVAWFRDLDGNTLSLSQTARQLVSLRIFAGSPSNSVPENPPLAPLYFGI